MLPHHDGSPLYVSNQEPALGDAVEVRLRIPGTWGPVSRVYARANPDREPLFVDAARIASADGWDWWEAPVVVENLPLGYRCLIVMQDRSTHWVNAAGTFATETLDSEDFRLLAYPPPPAWGRSSVMYQIFPDRFARSAAAELRPAPDWAKPAKWTDEPIHTGPNTPLQYYGGDLAGIQEHLDHLERLGVNLIYLTPFFPARSNHRYDATSFDVVDPLLGGDEAFAELVAVAHERGFKVIGDLTSNHSGDTHEWFTAAHRNPAAPESAYYYFQDERNETYASWLGERTLPKFNWASDELLSRFISDEMSVVAKWLRPPYSLDGWRIDVANMTGRHLDEDLNAIVRRTIRERMLSINPDTLLVAESTNDATHDFQGDGWHGAMTYANFTRPLWAWLSKEGPAAWFFGLPYSGIPRYTGQQATEAYGRFTSGLPWRVRLHMMNALDTHDTGRFATHAMPGALPVAVGMQMTLPGIPLVWAGDEFGLEGEDGEHSRTPIPWDDVDAAASTIDLYAALIRMRLEHVALTDGGLRCLHASEDLIVYVREHESGSVLVAAARDEYDVELEEHAVAGKGERVFGDGELEGRRLRGAGPSFTAWVLPGVRLSTAKR